MCYGIVGVGNHSGDGVPRIKRTVKEQCHRLGLRVCFAGVRVYVFAFFYAVVFLDPLEGFSFFIFIFYLWVG